MARRQNALTERIIKRVFRLLRSNQKKAEKGILQVSPGQEGDVFYRNVGKEGQQICPSFL